jgi:hypothetical protein
VFVLWGFYFLIVAPHSIRRASRPSRQTVVSLWWEEHRIDRLSLDNREELLLTTPKPHSFTNHNTMASMEPSKEEVDMVIEFCCLDIIHDRDLAIQALKVSPG